MDIPSWVRHFHGGNVTIAGVGVSVFAFYLTYITVNEAYLRGPVWLFPLGLLLMSVLTVGLLYGAYWLAKEEFSYDQGMNVTIWCFAGLVAALALTFWPIFYQRIVGVTIEDPLFILLVSVGLGANAGVVAGISQIRSEQRFERVENARDSLDFLNRLLRHNILNSIQIVRGNAELISDQAEDETLVERAETIQRQSDQMNDVVQNTKILIEQIEGDVECECVELSSVVENELETARNTFEEAQFESDIESDVDVWANQFVSAIVENLLTNAVEHNDGETPHVETTLETRDGTVVLQITDDGPGIPDENKEAVTNPGPHGDYGIGLHLVETLTDHYGGTVRFDDNEPRGTVATVELRRCES